MFIKDRFWQAKQTNVQGLHPELSYNSFFTREFLTKNNMTVVTYPPYFSLFLRLKEKLEGRHFETVEVLEAECRRC
jgi:hypothetical protein